MRLVAAGVSYRSAPLRARERAAAAVSDPQTSLRFLVGHAGLAGAALLSTCNRTEFYVTCPERTVPEVAPRLARYLDPGGAEQVASHLEERHDADAAEHLFRVAAGLESMVVGEAQVLGQVKDAHRAAREAGTLDARLDFVLRRAISAGKRVRSETPLGRSAGSMADLAVDAVVQSLGDLAGRGVLLLGAGAMSTLAAGRIRELGGSVLVTSRSGSSSRLAARVDGRAVALSDLAGAAGGFDAIITSTSSRRTVLSAEMVDAIQQRRSHRPLCIVDLAIPRDVDAAAAALEGVALIDVDALGKSARPSVTPESAGSPARGFEQTGSLRSLAGLRHYPARSLRAPMLAAIGDPADAGVAEAEAIIAAELARTMRALQERDAVTPTITALLGRAEAVRREELARTLDRVPGLDPRARERIDAMTQAMMRKLLHAPVSHLRDTKDDPAVALTLREAFDLES